MSCAVARCRRPEGSAWREQLRASASAAAAAVALACAVSGCATSAPRSTITVTAIRSPPCQENGAGCQVLQVFEGAASWYGREQHGHLTASGERFDMHAFTAAHRSLRMGTWVRVTNLRNGRQVVVRINDRGPYSHGRVLDLSYAAANVLGMLNAGVVHVRAEVLARP